MQQKPLKPEVYVSPGGTEIVSCSYCKAPVKLKYYEADGSPVYLYYNYCQVCGRPVDWSEYKRR